MGGGVEKQRQVEGPLATVNVQLATRLRQSGLEL